MAKEFPKRMYSPTMNKWLFGYSEDPVSDGLTFKGGYDDPTYLTFKVEFGDWGASILDREIIQLGVTTFTGMKSDYDMLPIGLLNAPSATNNDNSYWQNDAGTNAEIFNNADMYSAFAYLRSRNEDVRAEYLYYFVNGLFEIQKDFPYLFSKISGIESLESFDPLSGQRLKGAKIQLTCLEGLSLKIRTLMEFYRKAAWDDVYQRWILPENMREFKMIIYIFERRTFHDIMLVTGKDDNENNVDMYLDTRNVQDHPMVLQYDRLNADIPVKAYECCPCEFDIKSIWKNDYDAAYGAGGEELTVLSISVKNVKTFFKNKLLKDELHKSYATNGNGLTTKIDSFMIYDLVDSIEKVYSTHTYTDDANNLADNIYSSTLNGVRSMFLNKNILFENDDYNESIKLYIHGYIQDYGKLFKYNNESTKNTNVQDIRDDYYSQTDKNFAAVKNEIETSNLSSAKWMKTLLQMPSYNPNQSFWTNLGSNTLNILTGARRNVLIASNVIGGSNNLLQDQITASFLDFIIPGKKEMIASWATLGDLLQMTKLHDEERNRNLEVKQIQGNIDPERTINMDEIKDTGLYDLRLINDLEFDLLDNERQVEEQNMLQLEKQRDLNDQNLITLDKERQIEEQNMLQLEKQRDLNDQNLITLDKERNLENQLFAILEKERTLSTDIRHNIDNERLHILQNLEKLDKEREKYALEMNTLDKERKIVELTYSKFDKERKLLDIQLEKIDKTRNLPEITNDSLEKERKIVELKYIDLEKERKISLQKTVELEKERTLVKLEFQNLDKERNFILSMDKILMIARKIPGFENVTMDDIRSIPKLQLEDISHIAERSVPDHSMDRIALIDYVSKATSELDTQFLQLEESNRVTEKAIIDMLKENEVLKQLDSENNKEEKTKKEFRDFIKLFSENSNDIHDALANNVLALKKQLLTISKDSIRSLPNLEFEKIEDTERFKDNVMISFNDARQLDDNAKLLGISENTVRQLSFLTLVGLLKELERLITNTLLQKDISQEIENTKPNKNKKKVIIVNEMEEPRDMNSPNRIRVW